MARHGYRDNLITGKFPRKRRAFFKRKILSALLLIGLFTAHITIIYYIVKG